MAYAEKRGKGPRPWRVKYKIPGGEASQSGFETKQAALGWGRDQEAKVRAGTWTDPGAGEITVSDWIDRCKTLHDVGPSTTANREYRIRRFIGPYWGKRTLNSLTGEEIAGWERELPAAEGISRSTARDARSLLHTILGDAATARPPLIPVNPAVRPRNRGRRTGRGLDRSPQRAWATPLEVLLVAERAALLAGRDDEFTMLVTIGYTGMRWGETIGLERDLLRPGLINVEWQLREVSGRFCRLPPKDDSYRSANVEPLTPVDIPPFLAGLLAAQAGKHARQRCACAAGHGGSGRYVFLGPDGGHHRNSNYARRIFRPACDGRHPPANGRPGRLVIADTTAWPGTPAAAWPPAVPGKPFAPQDDGQAPGGDVVDGAAPGVGGGDAVADQPLVQLQIRELALVDPQAGAHAGRGCRTGPRHRIVGAVRLGDWSSSGCCCTRPGGGAGLRSGLGVGHRVAVLGGDAEELLQVLAGDQASPANLDVGQVAAAHLVVEQVTGQAGQAGGLVDGVGQPPRMRVLAGSASRSGSGSRVRAGPASRSSAREGGRPGRQSRSWSTTITNFGRCGQWSGKGRS